MLEYKSGGVANIDRYLCCFPILGDPALHRTWVYNLVNYHNNQIPGPNPPKTPREQWIPRFSTLNPSVAVKISTHVGRRKSEEKVCAGDRSGGGGGGGVTELVIVPLIVLRLITLRLMRMEMFLPPQRFYTTTNDGMEASGLTFIAEAKKQIRKNNTDCT